MLLDFSKIYHPILSGHVPSFSSWIQVNCGGSLGQEMLQVIWQSLLGCLIYHPVSFASKCKMFDWLLQHMTAIFLESQMALRRARIFSVFFPCESWPEHKGWQEHTYCLYKRSLIWPSTHPEFGQAQPFHISLSQHSNRSTSTLRQEASLGNVQQIFSYGNGLQSYHQASVSLG